MNSLTTGQVYRVRILAFNIIGTGAPSTILEIMPASLPGAPNQPTVTLSSSSQITLTWTQDAGTDGGSEIYDYIVYFDNGQGGNQEVAAESTSNLLTHTESGLSQGT